MCILSKTPSAPAPPPPPQYLHNPYLDGASMGTGLNKGRNSLVTSPISAGLNASGPSGPGISPSNPGPLPRPGLGTPVAPNAGLTMAAGTQSPGPQIPMVAGQPGSVVPTVGGVLAGTMAGRVTQPTAPPPGAARQ